MRRAALLALAILATGCGGGEPRPAAPVLFGFNDSSPLRGQMTPIQSAEAARRAGADSVRLTIEWQHTEGRPGAVGLGRVDAVYRAHVARGIRPLLVITGAPRWAWPPGRRCRAGTACGHPPGPAADAAFGRFAGLVAARYPQAAGIEVWNEPNLRSQWLPAPEPARYARLLEAAHDAVKAVDPEMPVLGGSVAAILDDDSPEAGMSIRRFLDGMYAAGAAEHMDGLAVHAYPTPGNRDRAAEAIGAALAARDAHDDDSPLWITETGISSTEPGGSERLQAEVIAGLLPRLRAREDVRAVYLHTLIEPTVWPAGHPSRGYGVLRPDLTPKPAYCRLARCPESG